MKTRFAAVVAVGLFLLAVGLPSSAAAATPLTIDISGLTCSNGVCTLPSGNVGTNYNYNVLKNGGTFTGGIPGFTVVVGSLPPGLTMPSSFSAAGTIIAGTPTQAGTFAFTVQVNDDVGNTAQQAYTLTIGPPLPLVITFPSSCCPAGAADVAYSQNLFASGGVPPYAWSIASGHLPPGLSLAPSSPSSISGTPTTAGTFTFTVQVTDSTGVQATKAGSITISDNGGGGGGQ